MQNKTPSEPLHVILTREMFSIFYTLSLPDGTSEELEIEEVRAWFTERGADPDKMEKVYDQVWNFLRAEVLIENPRVPSRPLLPYSPDI
jgi:hypothetical protein